ncbi:hypothetical protein [Parafrankia sp. EUN1f]|uniref:hypothetical protein n=1 Tax=Parafrankia sp. EUN1f TaxID=102897 RepID=UPI0001C43F89|nr:hypothetical protein [Parafrankia sp. EUN1f]EFC79228.1 hypothetical protein FrEUN1fDRAFT_7644 [Parafrankia sp. EUN1f]
MTSSYKPTGGDGRYARLYLADLTPTPEDTAQAEHTTLRDLAADLDQALTTDNRAESTRLIRAIRARARHLAPPATAR